MSYVHLCGYFVVVQRLFLFLFLLRLNICHMYSCGYFVVVQLLKNRLFLFLFLLRLYSFLYAAIFFLQIL